MELNDLLAAKSIDPKHVLVFRHRPMEPPLRKVLPWLAATRPDVFNAYQRSHWARVETAMTKAKYVLSCIGQKPGTAMFIGLYAVIDWKPLTYDEFWQVPANLELRELGMTGLTGDRQSALWFNTELSDFYQDWKGKLILEWPGLERSWWRWADRNQIPVRAILEESALVQAMPAWNELVLTWEQLKVLPPSWKVVLAQWRGIYLIVDISDGKGYVGAAYGAENLLSRWQNYAATGHGGNKLLRARSPQNLRFSIVQRASPDMDADDVIQLESTWKLRLHTRDCGLNDN